MDCTVHGAAKSRTRLCHFNFHIMWKEEIPKDASSNTLFRQIFDVQGLYYFVWFSGKQHRHHPEAYQKCRGSIPDLWMITCSLMHPQVTDICIKIRKVCRFQNIVKDELSVCIYSRLFSWNSHGAHLLKKSTDVYFLSVFAVNSKLLPYGSARKESICNVEDLGSIPGLGRSPGEGKGYPLQYSSLENSMGCIVHGVTKSWTWLSDFHFHLFNMGDLGSIHGWGRSPAEGNGNPVHFLAWKIPWTEEPGRLQSMGSQRVGHEWATFTSLLYYHRQIRTLRIFFFLLYWGITDK